MNGVNTTKQQLRSINLLVAEAQGTNITGNNIPLTTGNNNDDFFKGLNSQMLGQDFRLNEI